MLSLRNCSFSGARKEIPTSVLKKPNAVLANGVGTMGEKMTVAELIQFPVSRCFARFLLSCSRLKIMHQLLVKRNNPHRSPNLWRTFAVAKPEKFQNQKKRKRLDEICLERFQEYSRTYIQSWIMQGKVFVDGRVVSKAGTPVSDKSVVEINAEIPKYVCRAGHKLEAAIDHFGLDVTGKVALDSGLSTGGFADCLLQYGVAYVYGVDVGYGQVADKIRRDERVSIIERTNLRYLSGLPQLVDIVTLDLSFISILMVMPAVLKLMKDESVLVTLVKPQFEARRSQVGGGGIVRDPRVHQEVLEKIINGVEDLGFCNKGWIESPLKGAEGNTEFLVCFQRIQEKKGKTMVSDAQIDKEES